MQINCEPVYLVIADGSPPTRHFDISSPKLDSFQLDRAATMSILFRKQSPLANRRPVSHQTWSNCPCFVLLNSAELSSVLDPPGLRN